MSNPSRKLWVPLAALVIALASPSLSAQPPAAPATPAGPGITLGTDCWHTEPGTQAELFLPPDACGAGSMPAHVTVKLQGRPLPTDVVKNTCGCQVDTKIEYIDPHGNVSTEKTIHAVKQRTTETTDVDTCVRRTQNVKFHGKGVAEKVDIQLVKLSLESVQPITCGFRDRTKKNFKLCIAESGPQDTGSMTFTPATLGKLSKGNVNLQRLHITYNVTFIEPGGSCAAPTRGAPVLKNQKLTLKSGRRPGAFEQLVGSP